MSYQTILVEPSDRVLKITVNRADKLNALTPEALREMTDAFRAAQNDASVRCLVLTGAGSKAFIAGADIAELSRLDAVSAKEFSILGNTLVSLIENLGKPVIASINGFALGGGCEVALGCTLRIASETAFLGQPEVLLGIMPGFGGSQRLARMVGKGRAMELCLLGDRIDARRAFELGIVNGVCRPEELTARTADLARRISNLPPVAVKYILEAVNRGSEASLSESLDYESHLFALCFATEDMKEGTRAFLEKREPKFRGR